MSFHYFQRSDHDAWHLLSSQGGVAPVDLAKAEGAKKLTILAVSQIISDGTDEEYPRNRDKVAYRGPLYFDINCRDDLGQAIRSGQELVGKLTHMGVPKGMLQVYLSGSKGLHILVNETLFTGKRFILRLPEIYKEMARDLFVTGLDYSVYSGGRGNSFRIVNLQRHDGKYRVPVTVDELNELTVERYHELVQGPREVEVDNPQGLVVCDLKALYDEAKKRVNAKPKLTIIASSADMDKIRESVPACIRMLCDSESVKVASSFSQLATQLAAYIVRAGVSQPVAESLTTRLASNTTSSKYNTPKDRRNYIEAQIRYVEHTPTFSFGCNAIRLLLSKHPCDGCAIEAGVSKDGDPAAAMHAETTPDGYCVKQGNGMKLISNFTFQPLEVFIDMPQDGSSPRRVGTRMDVMKGGVKVDNIVFDEDSFLGRTSFLCGISGLPNLTFLGSDLDVQKIKAAVHRASQGVGEIIQVYATGIHLDFVDDSTVLTYVEPDMSINSMQERGTHQILGKLLARPYFAHTPMCERGDREVDEALFHLLKSNQKYEIGLLIGWCMAAHYKAHLMHLYRQFPIMSLWGGAGTGKSKTAGLVTWLNGTDYMQKDSGVSAPSTSHDAMLEYLSSTTTVPRIIEEFNKSKMTRTAYTDIGERIKQSWNGESTLKGGLSRSTHGTMGRTNAETIAIPLSAPLIVISEQEIEVPAIQERSIRIHMTKVKRAHCRDHFRLASNGREHLRRFGKNVMSNALTTKLEAIAALMDKASGLLLPNMDDRPRYSLQVVLLGLWKLRELLGQWYLFMSMEVLDAIIKTVIDHSASGGNGYVKSEIDLVLQKMVMIVAISRSAEESKTGHVYLSDGMQYAVTLQYLILDPMLTHASYIHYCTVDERSVPVISKFSQFDKLIREEPYFVKYEPYTGMGGGRQMLYLDLKMMESKGIDINLLGWGG